MHCMSGGFLNYYLTRGAGVPLACDTLLLDSTPILPKPRAFTTFARQFMRDALPFGKVVDLFPQPLHLFLIGTRWSVTAFRLRVQHWFLRRLGRHPRAWRDLTTRWLRVSSSAARRGNYEPIVAHAARVARSVARRRRRRRPKARSSCTTRRTRTCRATTSSRRSAPRSGWGWRRTSTRWRRTTSNRLPEAPPHLRGRARVTTARRGPCECIEHGSIATTAYLRFFLALMDVTQNEDPRCYGRPGV